MEKKEPTTKGNSIWLSYVKKIGKYGREYYVVEFDYNAQEFVLKNLAEGNIDLNARLPKKDEELAEE